MHEIRSWLSARLPPSSPPSLLWDGDNGYGAVPRAHRRPNYKKCTCTFAQQYIPYDSFEVFFGLTSYTVTLRLAISCVCVYLAQMHQR